MLNGKKVILTVELQTQKQPGVAMLECFPAQQIYSLIICNEKRTKLFPSLDLHVEM